MQMIKLKLSVTNCFLIPINDDYLLVDTGYERDKERFYKQLKQHHISIHNIKYLLLTHYHDDHSGLVAEITETNPLCCVIMHRKALEHLHRGKNDLEDCKFINRLVAKLISRFTDSTKSAFPPYVEKDSDIIIDRDTSFQQLGIDIPGKIICTPGHTDDSISVIINEDCLCGDAAAQMLSILGTKNCIILLKNLQQYYKSWEKIIAEKTKTIFPAHGKPFSVQKLKKNIYKNKKENLVEIK